MAEENLDTVVADFVAKLRKMFLREALAALGDAPEARVKVGRLARGERKDTEHGQRVSIIERLSAQSSGITFGQLAKGNPLGKARLRFLLQGLVREKLVKKAGVRRGVRYSIPKT
jgi:hypothetical protein